jgi:hypothetical protein
MALKGIDDLVADSQGWFLALLCRTVMEPESVAIRSRFRVLHVVERVTASFQAGLTGRRDLVPDLVRPSGAATCEIMASHHASAFQFSESAVEQIAIGDGWPKLLFRQMRRNRHMGQLFCDWTKHFGRLIVNEHLERPILDFVGSVKPASGFSLDVPAHFIGRVLQGLWFHAHGSGKRENGKGVRPTIGPNALEYIRIGRTRRLTPLGSLYTSSEIGRPPLIIGVGRPVGSL